MADTVNKQHLRKRLSYTWRECFAKTLRDVKPTGLIEHSIDLKPNARPSYSKIPCYTKKECQFCDRIFAKMVERLVIGDVEADFLLRKRFRTTSVGL